MRNIRGITVTSASLVLAAALNAQSLTWISTQNNPHVFGISDDGKTLLTTDGIWKKNQSGFTSVPIYPRSLSGDGNVVVGYIRLQPFRYKAAYWSPSIGVRQLPDLGYGGEARDVSYDGSVIVGTITRGVPDSTTPVRWSFGSLEYIPLITGYTQGAPSFVSRNGQIVMGRMWHFWRRDRDPWVVDFRWVPNTTSAITGELAAMSPDGSKVVYRDGQNLYLKDYSSGGVIQLPANFVDYICVANNGTVVGMSNAQRALIWDSQNGLRDLTASYWQIVGQSTLKWPLDITPDGRYIAGIGYNAVRVRNEVFLLDTYVCSSHNGDVNGDNCVNDADLLLILFNYGQTGDNLGRLDTNCDGSVDDGDLLRVLFNFGSGC